MRISIGLAPAGRTLTVRVANDAAPAAVVTGTRRGLIGLRERVLECCGRFHAGPAANGEWVVEAELPAR